MSTPELDVVCIGGGPSNLSLAALAAPIDGLSLAVLERNAAFSWHPGIMLFEAQVQTAPIKDLVTLVDPTSPYSFLNYLATQRRLYRFVVACRAYVSRREFEQYFSWASQKLESVKFGVDVRAIEHDGRSFVVESSSGALRANNVVLGVGKMPFVPECAAPLVSDTVFHSSKYACQDRALAGRDVLLVGGGQSAAEIAMHLLSDVDKLPRRLVWVTARTGFQPMDDSPFTNEWFNPRYARHFHQLDPARRRELLDRQVLASDGVTESLLLAIYRRLYVLDYLEKRPFAHDLWPDHRLVGLRGLDGGYEATVESSDLGDTFSVRADAVILATGYRETIPSFMEPLSGRLRLDRGKFLVERDFSVSWDGPADHRIFVQGGARESHGIADPNLSLAAWRSAVILNRVCGREVYSVDTEGITVALRAAPPRVAVHGVASHENGQSHENADGSGKGRISNGGSHRPLSATPDKRGARAV
jgi:lysine N6-hydroxylase